MLYLYNLFVFSDQATTQLSSFQSKIDSFSFQTAPVTTQWPATTSDNSWGASRSPVALTDVKSLPKPDQWLGTIVANTSTTTSPTPSPVPRRAPPLAHLRAHSLGSENFFAPRTNVRHAQLNGIVDFNPSQTNLFASDPISNNSTSQGSQNSIASNCSSGIGTNSGTVSLNSGNFNTSQTGSTDTKPKDPFDAEWAAVATRNDAIEAAASTNPFVVSNTVKAFEVHL